MVKACQLSREIGAIIFKLSGCFSGYRFNANTRWPLKIPVKNTDVTREDGTTVNLPLPDLPDRDPEFAHFEDFKEPLSQDLPVNLTENLSPTASMLNSTYRWDAHAQVCLNNLHPWFPLFFFIIKVNGKQAYSANLDSTTLRKANKNLYRDSMSADL